MSALSEVTVKSDVTVLYVDDDRSLLDLTKTFLENRSDAIAVETTDSPTTALDLIVDGDYDAVISDYQMPEMDGLELLERVRNDHDDDVPFIIFTGRSREEVAIEALNLGADRYLQKGGDPTSQYGVLLQAIEQEVEHYRTQERLREREENLRTTLESIGDAVITTDGDGRVKRINDVGERLTGWREADALGRPLDTVFDLHTHDTDGNGEDGIASVRDGTAVNGVTDETLLVAKDGTERYVSTSAAPIRDDQDAVVGLVVVFRDVTEQRRRKRRQDRQQSTLIELANDDDVVDGNFDAAKRTITEAVSETLDVARVGIWLVDEDETTIRCVDLYDSHSDTHESGMEIQASEYPRYFEALETHRSIDATDARNDPRTSELTEGYLEPLGIASLLDATLRTGGGIEGVVCHEHVGEVREWTVDERRFSAEVADQVEQALLNRERREQERALRREKRFLDTTIDSLDDLFYVLDPAGSFSRWNDTFEAVTGYDTDEIASLGPADFFEPADVPRVQNAFERVVEDRERVTFRADIVTKSGETVPYELTGAPVEDDGTVIGVAGVGRDLTAVRETEMRYRKLLAASPAPTLLLSDEGEITYANGAAVSLFDADDESDLRGEKVFGLVHPEERPLAENRVESLFERRQVSDPAELRVVTLDGSIRHVVGVSSFLELGDEPVGQVVFNDVTEQVVIERELTETKRRYETLVEQNQVGIYVLTDRRFVYVNPRFTEIFGCEESAVIGKTPFDLTVPEDHDIVEAALATQPREAAASHTCRGIRADGEEIFVTFQGAHVEMDGDPAIIGTVVDVTREREQRQALERKTEQLNTFANVVTHDLQSPVNVALGRVDLARDTGEIDHLDQARDALVRVNEIVTDLSSLMRGGTVVDDVRPVDLDDVVASVVSTLGHDDLSVTVLASGRIHADEVALKRLLENLFKNAVEHGDGDPHVIVGVTDGGFFVEDDGPGIPERDRSTVFEPGYTTKADGAGFGMVSVQQIVREHGWQIAIEDGTDGGTRFEIDGVEFVEDA